MHWQSEWRINLSWLGRIWWKLGFHDSLHIKYHPILLWIIHLLSLPRRRWSHSRGPDTLTSRIDITACFIHAQIHTTCYCCVRCAHRDSHSSTILQKKKNAEKWSWFHIFRLGQTMKTAKKKCIYRCENNGLLKAASIQFWVPVIFFLYPSSTMVKGFVLVQWHIRAMECIYAVTFARLRTQILFMCVAAYSDVTSEGEQWGIQIENAVANNNNTNMKLKPWK